MIEVDIIYIVIVWIWIVYLISTLLAYRTLYKNAIKKIDRLEEKLYYASNKDKEVMEE